MEVKGEDHGQPNRKAMALIACGNLKDYSFQKFIVSLY